MKRILTIVACGFVLVGVAGFFSCSLNNTSNSDVIPAAVVVVPASDDVVIPAPEMAPVAPEVPVVADEAQQTVVPVEELAIPTETVNKVEPVPVSPAPALPTN